MIQLRGAPIPFFYIDVTDYSRSSKMSQIITIRNQYIRKLPASTWYTLLPLGHVIIQQNSQRKW